MSNIPSVSGEPSGGVKHPPLSHFYQLPTEKEQELKRLYKQLDVDGDGKIDAADLVKTLQERMSEASATQAAKKIIATANRHPHSSKSGSETIDFAEFVHYVMEHEKNLALVFRDLDRNSDGVVDYDEVLKYFEKLGIRLNRNEAMNLVRKMDKDGNMSVSLDEFQDYLMFHPSWDPKEIAQFWRHSLIIDIGENSLIPVDFSESEYKEGAWWRHLVAGACAGAVSRTSTAPLDRLKVFMQVHASKKNRMSLFSALKYLYSEGGAKSFWRGNGVNVVKIAPEQAIKFMTYEQMKRLIKGDSTEELSILERLLAGSSAGAISQSAIYPMEVLKTRLALRKTGEMNRGVWSAAKTIYGREGLRAFYKGYVPNTIGILPYAGIDLAIYETLKKRYISSHESIKEPTVLVTLGCGALSSTCGQLASYPLALVRTRLQALAIKSNKDMPETMIGQFQWILQNEGFFGLYRGLTANFMKVLPAVSISYVVYESTRKRLGVHMT